MSEILKAVCTSVQDFAEVTRVSVVGDGVGLPSDAQVFNVGGAASDYAVQAQASGELGRLGFRTVGEWVQVAPEFPVFVEHDLDHRPLRLHRFECDVVKV